MDFFVGVLLNLWQLVDFRKNDRTSSAWQNKYGEEAVVIFGESEKLVEGEMNIRALFEI